MCETAHLAVSPWGFGYIPENSCEQPQIPVLQLPNCAFSINLLTGPLSTKEMKGYNERGHPASMLHVIFQCNWCIVSFFIILVSHYHLGLITYSEVD